MTKGQWLWSSVIVIVGGYGRQWFERYAPNKITPYKKMHHTNNQASLYYIETRIYVYALTRVGVCVHELMIVKGKKRVVLRQKTIIMLVDFWQKFWTKQGWTPRILYEKRKIFDQKIQKFEKISKKIFRHNQNSVKSFYRKNITKMAIKIECEHDFCKVFGRFLP